MFVYSFGDALAFFMIVFFFVLLMLFVLSCFFRWCVGKFFEFVKFLKNMFV